MRSPIRPVRASRYESCVAPGRKPERTPRDAGAGTEASEFANGTVLGLFHADRDGDLAANCVKLLGQDSRLSWRDTLL